MEIINRLMNEMRAVKEELAQYEAELEPVVSMAKKEYDKVSAPLVAARKDAKTKESTIKDRIYAIFQEFDLSKLSGDDWTIHTRQNKSKITADAEALWAIYNNDPLGNYAWLDEYLKEEVPEPTLVVTLK